MGEEHPRTRFHFEDGVLPSIRHRGVVLILDEELVGKGGVDRHISYICVLLQRDCQRFVLAHNL